MGRWKYMGRMARREAMWGWILAGPWVIGFLFLTAGAMGYALVMSFTRWDMINEPAWIGLENYRHMVSADRLVWHSIRITTIYTAMNVPLLVITGLAMALLLNKPIRARGVFRTLLYMPSVLPEIAVIMVWLLVYNPTFGLANSLLQIFGVEGPHWLGDPSTALPAIVVMSIWGVGGGMLIYLAGLQGIPTDLYEAATIDGASAARKFIRITVPMLSPVIFFNFIMGLIGSLQAFNQAYVMTEGGPVRATYFLMLHLYIQGFRNFDMGYASALAWLLFLYIGLITIAVFAVSRRVVYYES